MERFGGLLSVGNATAQTLSLGYERLINWEYSNAGVGCAISSDGCGVRAKVDGNYFIFGVLSFTGAVGDYDFVICRNGAELPFVAKVDVANTGQHYNVAVMGGYRLRIGDEVAIYAKSNGANAITVVSGQFGISSM